METVEHDPVVIEAIERTCFSGNAIPFRCVVDDAREYLETKVMNGSLDIISMDAFDGGGNVPEHLISRAFFRLCGEKLKNNNNNQRSPSMFIMNCFNGVRGSTARAFVHVICARLEKSIGPVMTIPIHDQPCNVIVVALLKKEEEKKKKRTYALNTPETRSLDPLEKLSNLGTRKSGTPVKESKVCSGSSIVTRKRKRCERLMVLMSAY